MKALTLFLTLLITCVLTLAAGQATADEIHVAVASNFTNTIKTLAGRFEASSGHRVILSFGSTGKHYAQIKNGAPFDAFFAADVKRPKLLDKEGVALPGSRFTYAIGKIVLWGPKKGSVDAEGKVLEEGKFRHLAIANPKLAPYGRAARQVLQDRGIWESLQNRMVRGENIGQTFQFIKSRNAELGFVALSQIIDPGHAIEGSLWKVPQSLYTPIEQQAVLLRESDAARAFLTFVKNDESLEIIRGFGYATP
ncbi:MAG: molybdate ABC transporter substrate-binding protein [Gammaproteobacteria bacterium]|nr:molybdate ABC transporter substrate-binding protein [Gammaproteobacteria bacterium]